ncbi:MAG: MmcQ/YjbR family DNA-binding protein [Candidatus Korobacteraceae bacterium]|jgi:predicted DNA-binding protein (MmcQ/YjbR family)
MDIEAIRQYCLRFPHTTENMQWGADLCFKVDGKLFVVAAIEMVPQRLSFKCSPESFAELCEREGIIPAPYMARAQWVSLLGTNVVADDELRDLIAESYRLVWERLPKKRRAELEAGGARKEKKTALHKAPSKTKSAGARKKR